LVARSSSVANKLPANGR